jgi:hypothetical protein
MLIRKNNHIFTVHSSNVQSTVQIIPWVVLKKSNLPLHRALNLKAEDNNKLLIF